MSLVEAVKGILASQGIRGLFVGYYATLVRDIPYTMLELGIYENLKVVLAGLRVKNEEVTAAAVTGAVAAFITTPLDLVKTKLMMQAATGGKYSGVVDAITRYFSCVVYRHVKLIFFFIVLTVMVEYERCL